MKRPTKVHCLFEQSGTFKNEFIKLGIPAEDYDIQNNHGETDHVIDLFAEIEAAYDGRQSIFDGFSTDHLVLAFFPCIYFSKLCQIGMSLKNPALRKKTKADKYGWVLDKMEHRHRFLELLVKMVGVCDVRGLRLVFENPWSAQGYLRNGFILSPSVIDNDRTQRGDVFVKPTAYWFIGCSPTHCATVQKKSPKRVKDAKGSKLPGLCSEERSMISADYARNFIADFILGEPIGNLAQQQELAL